MGVVRHLNGQKLKYGKYNLLILFARPRENSDIKLIGSIFYSLVGAIFSTVNMVFCNTFVCKRCLQRCSAQCSTHTYKTKHS